MKINIPLSEQVVSREVAVQLNEALKKAGIEVEANYVWYREDEHNIRLLIKTADRNYSAIKDKSNFRIHGEIKNANWIIPTHTLPELLAVLSNKMVITKIVPADKDLFLEEKEYTAALSVSRWNYFLWLTKFDIQYVDTLGVIALLDGSRFKTSDTINIATAAAKLIIWCVENGHLGGGE
jgi:hypothetical protein